MNYNEMLGFTKSAKDLIIKGLIRDLELRTIEIQTLLNQEFNNTWHIDNVIDIMLLFENDFRLVELNNDDAIWTLTDKKLSEVDSTVNLL